MKPSRNTVIRPAWRLAWRLASFALGAFLGACLLLGTQAQAATAPVPLSATIEPQSGYDQAAQALATRGIANNPGDPHFAPTDAVTRAADRGVPGASPRPHRLPI